MKKLNLTERCGFSQIFLLVGMLLIAISLPIATELVQKNQENRGRALEGDDFVVVGDGEEDWSYTTMVNGECGTDNESTTNIKPSIDVPNICRSGYGHSKIISPDSGAESFVWYCYGQNGANVKCFTLKPSEGSTADIKSPVKKSDNKTPVKKSDVSTKISSGCASLTTSKACEDYGCFWNTSAKKCSATCTSFTYTYGNCVNGVRSVTIKTKYPAGCVGGSPITSDSKSCSPCCGSLHELTVESLPTTGHCKTDSKYTDLKFDATNNKWTWRCSETKNCAASDCYAIRKIPSSSTDKPEADEKNYLDYCGSANGYIQTNSQPSGDSLCKSGLTAGSVKKIATVGEQIWQWTCTNTSTNKYATCTATYNECQANGGVCKTTCGVNESHFGFTNETLICDKKMCCKPDTVASLPGICNKTYNEKQIPSGTNLYSVTDLCTQGSITWVNTDGVNGILKWDCIGLNGGEKVSCEAYTAYHYSKCSTSHLTGSDIGFNTSACGTKTDNEKVLYICDDKGGLTNKTCSSGCVQKSTTTAECKSSDGSGSSGQTTTLSLTPSSLALKVGETGLVMPSINPKTSTVQTFTWLSSNTAVAITYIPKCSDTLVSKCTSLADTFSVVGVGTSLCSKCAGNENEGLVQARGVGKAIVSVNATPSNVGTSMLITVTAADLVVSPTTPLTVSPSVVSLRVGESGVVKANQSVTWSSSNAAVAQVTVDGVVIGKAVGNVTITATNAAGKTATVAVTVKEKEKEEEVVGDGDLSFKIAFDGVKPNAIDREGKPFSCFEHLGDLTVDVLNRTTNAYDTYSDVKFAVDGNNVDSKGNQIFQVSNMKIKSSLVGVDTDNAVKVKGLYHIKRRMCKDGQKEKVDENTVCDVDLTEGSPVYDFSEYVLLAGDVNRDGKVDTEDFSIVKTALDAGAELRCGVRYDLNLDGVVNSLDTGLIRDHSLAERDDE